MNVKDVAAVADTALDVPAGAALLAPVPAFTSAAVGTAAESANMTHLTFSERLRVIESTSDVLVQLDVLAGREAVVRAGRGEEYDPRTGKLVQKQRR